MRSLVAAVALCGVAPLTAADADFTPLFNGKSLDGWKLKKDGSSLDGKTEAANGRFKVADGILTIDPKVKGDIIIETVRTFSGDVHLKFEYLPGMACNNDLFFRGIKFDIKKGDVKNIKWDEWNTFEIVVTGKSAEFRNNGETLKTVAAKADATTFGLRAELGPMQVRNLVVKGGK